MSDRRTFARTPARAAGLGLTATDWSVLHALCLFANRDGYAHASLSRIGEIARIMDRGNVAHSTRRLLTLGLIEAERVSRGNGWGNTQYRVIYGPLQDDVLSEETACVLSEETACVLSEETAPENGVLSEDTAGAVSGHSTGAVFAPSQALENTGQKSPLTDKKTDVPTDLLTREEEGQEVERER